MVNTIKVGGSGDFSVDIGCYDVMVILIFEIILLVLMAVDLFILLIFAQDKMLLRR